MFTKEELLVHLKYDKPEIDQDHINEARNNNRHAFSRIGFAYQFGEVNYFKAMAWYQLGANENDEMAYNNIGCLYSVGHGVYQDYHIAIEYFLKAAKLGSTFSMGNIGEQFFHGRGVTSNLYYALAWYLKSGKRPAKVLELYKKGIFLRKVDQKKTIYQLVNETSDILREERIQKEMKNTEALRGRIQDLQSQSQLVREENRLYKQKLESLETLFRSQKNKKVALIRKIALLDPYRQIDRKLEALEEPIALIVNNENTNDNQYRPNGAHIDTIKVAEIKEEPLPCEMSAKRKHSTTASNP